MQIGSGNHQHNTWQVVVSPRIAVAAVAVLAVVGGVVLWSVERGRGADVRLAALSVGRPEPVGGTAFVWDDDDSGNTGRVPAGPARTPVTPIDITLTNDGGSSAVVVAASVTLVVAGLLEDCRQGGGPVEVEADYDVKLPRDPPPVPFTVTRDMRFEVRPHASERFTLTVGPRDQGDGPPEARVYVADVSLTIDGSPSLAAGRAAWVTRSGDGYRNLRESLPSDNPDCRKRNAATMRRFTDAGGVRSDEASRLVTLYRHLTAPDGDLYPQVCEYGGADPVGRICAVFTRDVVVVTVGLYDSARGGRLLIRLATIEATVRHVVDCLLTGADEPPEARLVAPDPRPATVDPCGGYVPEIGYVWLYAYPAADLNENELVVTARVAAAGGVDAPPIDRSTFYVVARRSG